VASPLRICQTSFSVADLDRSVAFYRDVLGLPLVRVTDGAGQDARVGVVTGYAGARLRVAFFDVQGHELELIQYVTPAGRRTAPERRDAGAAHIAFAVADADAAYQELRAKGVRFVSPPQDFGTVKACYFTDPDGITLELLQRRTTS
jgi:catechol 2,3-dioxygenase-like lactoylglutathione lyase family enzyme